MKYFFDTYALFEIIGRNKNYEKFSNEEIVTSTLSLGELYYGLLKNHGKKIAIHWFNKFKNSTIPINENTIRRGMDFKFENRQKKFSFVDCVGYAAARNHSLMFLTGDNEFGGIPGVEFVK